VLRKTKAIRKVVQQHHLIVIGFTQQDLVGILQYLLREGIFASRFTARSIYPELFPLPAVEQDTE
jgi:hypothetical protein